MPDISALQNRLAPVLAPFGALYSRLMRLRRTAYASGRAASWRADRPVASVGNIGWGGSGKTPLCAHILDLAEAEGRRVVVLTRGYGARPRRLPLLVTPDADPAECGDEPLLLARRHPSARVVVDPKRSRSGPWACARFDPDFVLLDDGFQHLPVARDTDLVLLTPRDLGAGWNRVCPAGTWREGASALAAAAAFLVKAGNGDADALDAAVRKRLGPYGRPVFVFDLAPQGLMRLDGGAKAADLGGADYVFATGIADPLQAAATAKRLLGRAPRQVLPFADHHAFGPQDVLRLAEAAAGAAVVVTEKDAVKLSRLPGAGGFWSLRTDVRFLRGLFADADFDAWLAARLDAPAGRGAADARERA